MPRVKTPGEHAYDAYAARQSVPMPAWADLDAEIREGFEAAARRAMTGADEHGVEYRSG